MKTTKLFVMMIIGMVLCACNQPGKNQQETSAPAEEVTTAEETTVINTLTAEEAGDGWVLLFDGKTTDGWKNFNEDTLTGWHVEDGCLVAQGLGGDIGGDIVTIKDYENFILKWEWKLGPHGNSGVLYHVIEDTKYAAVYATGPEYQMIEDGNFKDEHGEPAPLEPWQETAADYAMYVANDQKKINVRDWNSSKIFFTPEKAEYWLNGKKVVEFVPWSDDWNEKRNSGKWDEFPDYGLFRTGKISLQDHGSKVWFRNIKIKEL